MKQTTLLLVALILCATLGVNSQNRKQFKREPFVTDTPMVHDPVMAFEDSTYHIFATGMGIQHMTSADRKNWTVHAEPVMSVIPKWAHDSVPGFTHHVWAPDVIKWHDRWWMAYSCSTFGKNGSAIGLLSTRKLAFGLWDDEGCIVTSREKRDNWNAIDPNFVIDENDQPWLVWGSFWDGIQIVRLDTTMHIPAVRADLQSASSVRGDLQSPRPKTIARRYNPNHKPAEPNPTSQFAGPNAIEAPFIFKHGEYYYLFVSWDYCCRGSKSNYRVAVGRSKTVDGPYIDSNGVDMRLGGGNLFIEGDKKQFEAAGHCAVYHIGDEDIFICHGYSIAHKGASILIQKPVVWTADGWPTLGN